MRAAKVNLPRYWRPVDVLVSFLIFGILCWFTYGILFVGPYAGINFNPSNGEILKIYANNNSSADLRVGDFIEQIDSVTLSEYQNDKNVSFFRGAQAGEVVTIIARRDGELVSVPWVYPGFNQAELMARFFNIWWLAYIFWIFGTATQIVVRPRDLRSQLMVAVNYLTALFIIFGSLSARQIWMSSALLHATAWLILPVYIHFHWIFPSPLRKIPQWAWITFYIACFGLATAEVLLPTPRPLYFIAALLALVGSMSLLIAHLFRMPAQRGTIRILTTGSLLALLPATVVSVIGIQGQVPQIGALALFALPIMPAAYFYAVYRDHFGGLELRSNRAVSIYAFLILLGTTILFLMGLIGLLNISLETVLLAVIITALLVAWFTIALFPSFEAMIERRMLGISLSLEDLPKTYSARITASADLPSLLKLLEEEIFPSLLVRQYAFLQTAHTATKVVLSKNVTDDQIQEEALTELIASFQTHRRLPIWEEGQPLDWVRAILPPHLDAQLIGAWLLGRRDPDDLYLRAELPILQSLADQTAMALSNILQAERLRRMYEDDIDRNEKSRLQLALDLHDSVLNQLAVLRLNVDETHVSPKFQKAYEEVTSRLREIVTDLRPPMLGYGLQFAIEELADNLMERSKEAVKVAANVQVKGEARYPEKTEQHIFRIVQEACENALRHSSASRINILAKLAPESIWLLIEDDGIGFQVNGGADLDGLLANRHFGLAGMMERARLIGANVEINSYLKAGTRIEISWDVHQAE